MYLDNIKIIQKILQDYSSKHHTNEYLLDLSHLGSEEDLASFIQTQIFINPDLACLVLAHLKVDRSGDMFELLDMIESFDSYTEITYADACHSVFANNYQHITQLKDKYLWYRKAKQYFSSKHMLLWDDYFEDVKIIFNSPAKPLDVKCAVYRIDEMEFLMYLEENLLSGAAYPIINRFIELLIKDSVILEMIEVDAAYYKNCKLTFVDYKDVERIQFFINQMPRMFSMVYQSAANYMDYSSHRDRIHRHLKCSLLGHALEENLPEKDHLAATKI